MSKDIQVSHLCPHHIRYESYSINNLKDLYTRSPISGSGLLIIRKDNIEIPNTGLLSSASIIFPLNGPYRIVNPTYTIKYKDITYTVNLELGLLNSIQILNAFKKALLGSKIEILEYQKSIEIRTLEKGYSARLEINGDLKAFGFLETTFKVNGKILFPGWKLYKRIDDTGYFIRFDDVVKKADLQIDYVTSKNYCNRCASTGTENDLRFNEYGEIKTIDKHDLLYQQVSKVCLTKLNSNPQHSWYGTKAFNYVGVKQQNNAKLGLSESVREAITQHISIQQQVSKLQNLTLEEQIASVRSIDVEELDNGLSYLINIGLVSRALSPININILFAVPGSIDLSEK